MTATVALAGKPTTAMASPTDPATAVLLARRLLQSGAWRTVPKQDDATDKAWYLLHAQVPAALAVLPRVAVAAMTKAPPSPGCHWCWAQVLAALSFGDDPYPPHDDPHTLAFLGNPCGRCQLRHAKDDAAQAAQAEGAARERQLDAAVQAAGGPLGWYQAKLATDRCARCQQVHPQRPAAASPAVPTGAIWATGGGQPAAAQLPGPGAGRDHAPPHGRTGRPGPGPARAAPAVVCLHPRPAVPGPLRPARPGPPSPSKATGRRARPRPRPEVTQGVPKRTPSRLSGRETGRPQPNGAAVTERLERRGRVMRVFAGRPGAALDPDQVSQATGLPARQAKAILATLQADGWLRRVGSNKLGHPAWQRTTDADNHDHAAVTTSPAAPPAPGALRPGHRQFFCKQCRQGVEATDCPDGWLRVQLHDAATQARDGCTFLTVALFCRLACLRTWRPPPPRCRRDRAHRHHRDHVQPATGRAAANPDGARPGRRGRPRPGGGRPRPGPAPLRPVHPSTRPATGRRLPRPKPSRQAGRLQTGRGEGGPGLLRIGESPTETAVATRAEQTQRRARTQATRGPRLDRIAERDAAAAVEVVVGWWRRYGRPLPPVTLGRRFGWAGDTWPVIRRLQVAGWPSRAAGYVLG
jgi:hypothetical protein